MPLPRKSRTPRRQSVAGTMPNQKKRRGKRNRSPEGASGPHSDCDEATPATTQSPEKHGGETARNTSPVLVIQAPGGSGGSAYGKRRRKRARRRMADLKDDFVAQRLFFDMVDGLELATEDRAFVASDTANKDSHHSAAATPAASAATGTGTGIVAAAPTGVTQLGAGGGAVSVSDIANKQKISASTSAQQAPAGSSPNTTTSRTVSTTTKTKTYSRTLKQAEDVKRAYEEYKSTLEAMGGLQPLPFDKFAANQGAFRTTVFDGMLTE